MNARWEPSCYAAMHTPVVDRRHVGYVYGRGGPRFSTEREAERNEVAGGAMLTKRRAFKAVESTRRRVHYDRVSDWRSI